GNGAGEPQGSAPLPPSGPRTNGHLVPTAGQVLVNGAFAEPAVLPYSQSLPAEPFSPGSGLLRALSHRLALGVSLGLILALTTATLIWFLFPAKSAASALIQTSANERRVLTDRADPGNNGMDVAMFHRTQAALIKSHRIVSVAVTSKSPVDRFV